MKVMRRFLYSQLLFLLVYQEHEKSINTSRYNFKSLIENGRLYVDKTKYLYRLVGKPDIDLVFCSRPRRFGKSLTLSTLEEIFSGNKELFKGLYIYDTDYDWKKYPIIHIDFGNCDAKNGEELKEWLISKLLDVADEYSISIPKNQEIFSYV